MINNVEYYFVVSPELYISNTIGYCRLSCNSDSYQNFCCKGSLEVKLICVSDLIF